MNVPSIFVAARFLSSFPRAVLRVLREALLIIGGVLLAVWFVAQITLQFGIADLFPLHIVQPSSALGLAIILLTFGCSVVFFELFVNRYLVTAVREEGADPIEYCDISVAEALIHAEQAGNGSVSHASLLRALAEDKSTAHLWLRLGIHPDSLLQLVAALDQSPRQADQERVYEGPVTLNSEGANLFAKLDAERRENEQKHIHATDVIIGLFDSDTQIQSFFLNANISRDDLVSLRFWFSANTEHKERRRRFWSRENLMRIRPIGAHWTYGYTPTLNRFSRDVTDQIRRHRVHIELVGRDEVVRDLERMLVRSGENNALLVGDAGVGKHTIVSALTERILYGLSLKPLRYMRVLELDVSALFGASTTDRDIEARTAMLFSEAIRAQNVILVLHDLHTIVGSDEGVGRVNISEVIKPFLDHPSLRIIATSDSENYHRHIEPRGDIQKFFETISVPEPSAEQTVRILQTLVPYMEQQYRVFITQPALKKIVYDADSFIHHAPFPEKAIDLLHDVAVAAETEGGALVTPEHVDRVVREKTHVAVGGLSVGEREGIETLEKRMRERIVNQEHAIKALSNTITRLMTGISRKDAPAGSFLFVGPTGVGKTYTTRRLADLYFGSEDQMIRFDMSEFQNPNSIDRFIGSRATGDPGQFTSAVRDNPFSVILLDEIEKAHPSILHLLLQVLDEARLTDAFGRTVSFQQSIIIATSNAGAEHIRLIVQEGGDPADQKKDLTNYLLSHNLFAPEFINRFDDLIIFHPLSKEHVHEVAALLLGDLADRLKEQNYLFEPSDEIVSFVAENGFDPQFGARPMRRVIQDTVEVVVSQKILNRSVERGVPFSVSVSDLEDISAS